MKIIGIIPARMAASRFPGKPMENILGIPMIEHCYKRSRMCKIIDDVFVATCDIEIFNHITKIGGNAIMTSESHERATERTAEALIKIQQQNGVDNIDIIVMIQGDEPLVDPLMIEEILLPLKHGKCEISNLMTALEGEESIYNPNNVKVVFNQDRNALYMSREPIPSSKNYSGTINYFRQLGLIAFKRSALLSFIELKPSTHEIIESIDMNRFLDYGYSIQMVETKADVDAVDTPEDLIRVEMKMKHDELYHIYKII